MGDFYDGLEHGPKMLGSTVREPGKVDGVLSGTYQGVKGLFTGIYDGFSGLVIEPMEGHKKEVSVLAGVNRDRSLQKGAVGAVKGSLRSRKYLITYPSIQTDDAVVNLIMHPYRGKLRGRSSDWH
jgi:hypothetical protein